MKIINNITIGTFYQQLQPQKSNNTQLNHTNFTSRSFSEPKLNKLLENNKIYRQMNESFDRFANKAEEATSVEREKINKQITSIISDSNFLWTITTDKKKKSYLPLIAKVSFIRKIERRMECGAKTWEEISSQLREHFLSEKPETLISEIEEAEKILIDNDYKTRCATLKNLLCIKAGKEA